DRERVSRRLCEADCGERRAHLREPRSDRRAGRARRRPRVARPGAVVPRPRPAERRAFRLADRSQLRQPRRRPEPRAQGGAVSEPGHWFEREPLWFKTAVFYEIHVRGFYDANGDGLGDLRGIQEKLDYLRWLGVDCIWLLPMYASPLRDGGYDIADFFAIHPDYGNVDDFRAFVD